MFNVIIIRELQIQMPMRYQYTPINMSTIPKISDINDYNFQFVTGENTKYYTHFQR